LFRNPTQEKSESSRWSGSVLMILKNIPLKHLLGVMFAQSLFGVQGNKDLNVKFVE